MTYVRANLFYEREQWKKPVMLSIGFHLLLVATIVTVGFLAQPRTATNWGTNQGDAVEAQLVSAAIPIPHQEQSQNIVANESKGVTQTQPLPKPEETEDGISIKGKVKPVPPKPTKTVATNVKPPHPVPTPEDTAVPYGEGGPVSGPFGNFAAPSTKGGFSVQDSAFGNKYGWYIDIIRRKVQQNWLTYEIDPSIKAPHRAFIEFDITRDGSPAHVQVAQSSGVPSLDQSALRAIQRIDGFGALPEGSSLHVEFWFDHPPK
ncbi:MAG TPA: TonB family protein [Candidatus Limnocylindrales bacterium]|nr:TonB family protein [Candidatus Limnocylindrales bacterium]